MASSDHRSLLENAATPSKPTWPGAVAPFASDDKLLNAASNLFQIRRNYTSALMGYAQTVNRWNTEGRKQIGFGK